MTRQPWHTAGEWGAIVVLLLLALKFLSYGFGG
jgi:hypothetical protein